MAEKKREKENGGWLAGACSSNGKKEGNEMKGKERKGKERKGRGKGKGKVAIWRAGETPLSLLSPPLGCQ